MKEADIRPADLFQRYLELSRKDAQALFPDPSKFERVSCVGCGGNALKPAFNKQGFDYVDCDTCHSLFVNPRPTKQALGALYADSPSTTYWVETFFPAVMVARREKIFIPRVEQISAILRQKNFDPKVVLEVGAGYGMFLEEYKKRHPGVSTRAIEPGHKFVEICRQKGIETLEALVEDSASWKETADFVACFEVIEHVHSPKEFVRAVANVVKPGGYLWMTGLGVEGFDIQTLWEKSKSVSPPHHINFMTVEGFRKLFESVGLTDVDVTTPGKLDLDIVRNECATDAQVLGNDRFMQLLLKRRDAGVHEQFQKFLSQNQLSSHVWVIARKPAQNGR